MSRSAALRKLRASLLEAAFAVEQLADAEDSDLRRAGKRDRPRIVVSETDIQAARAAQRRFGIG